MYRYLTMDMDVIFLDLIDIVGGEYKIVGLDVEQVWEYGKERGEDFFSPIISEVQYIEES